MQAQSVITISRWMNKALANMREPRRVTPIDVFATAYKHKFGGIDRSLVQLAYHGFVTLGIVPSWVRDFIIEATSGSDHVLSRL